MLLKMGSQASHISCLEPQKTESLLYSIIAPKLVPVQVWLSLLVSLFLICRKERHFEISLKGRRRNLWSYASGEKYSGVWVRQLQNILITAVIDTEARLCELMNPKGAPLMWAGLWLSDWCKAMSEADGISEIADFGIGRPSSITFDLSPQTDGLITSRKGFWWDPKKNNKKRAPLLGDGMGFRGSMLPAERQCFNVGGLQTAFCIAGLINRQHTAAKVRQSDCSLHGLNDTVH